MQSIDQSQPYQDVDGKSNLNFTWIASVFLILYEGTSYLISADNNTVRDDWIRAITAACHHETIKQTKMLYSRALVKEVQEGKKDSKSRWNKLLSKTSDKLLQLKNSIRFIGQFIMLDRFF